MGVKNKNNFIDQTPYFMVATIAVAGMHKCYSTKEKL